MLAPISYEAIAGDKFSEFYPEARNKKETYRC